MAGEIGDRKQQIAQFFFELRGVGARRHDLVRFLGDLLDNFRRRIPIESDACRTFLKLHRTQQRGQGIGHARQYAAAVMRALAAFVFLPGDGLCLGRFDPRRLAENMRMTAEHLVGDSADNIGEIEQIALFRHARVEHHLQQQIAEFVLERRPVRILDRAGHFIGFLDRIGRDGGEGLGDIPGATVFGIAQAAHDVEQLGDGEGGRLSHRPTIKRCDQRGQSSSLLSRVVVALLTQSTSRLDIRARFGADRVQGG